ncbi:hypothetical protein QAD02_002050 [Eretmocerus hayati]|uniref:Uncharacterized protein n=1 Tax=Eretmocerus hayati TaxID=131215 RepID=A0ACC2NI66_9HYME|nr:hypothetical protein QAD02_002050 [Eretmocerus hayati]
MDYNYRANAGKWLPRASPALEKFINDSSLLRETTEILANRVAALLRRTAEAGSHDLNGLKDLIRELEQIIPDRRMLSLVESSGNKIFQFKVENLMFSLGQKINILARYIKDLINEITCKTNDEFLRNVFRLVNVYNELLNLDHDVSVATVNIFSNDCPTMSEPLKKISVSRLLQILAKNGAENCCHELIDCLLAIYRSTSDEEVKFMNVNDSEISENSSIEIYRTLTKHITTPLATPNSTLETFSHMESMQMLVNKQNDQVLGILNVLKNISPQLLGPDATKNKDDEMRIRRKALERIFELNQDVVWSSVSSMLDHVVLWWSSEALAARHSHGSQHLKDWLHQFIQGNDGNES